MRLWKLQELFDQARKLYPTQTIIHICTNCGWKTPAPANLIVLSTDLKPEYQKIIELKENVCDECNQKTWTKIVEHNEWLKNNCDSCGGGRCRHYVWKKEECKRIKDEVN